MSPRGLERLLMYGVAIVVTVVLARAFILPMIAHVHDFADQLAGPLR
jgi:hypothetical protein